MTLNAQNLVAWHDRTPKQHKALVDKWAAKGFRTLSVSIYGTPQAPFLTAVMVKRPVIIATKQFGPLDQAGIQAKFDEMAKKGWGPYILSATGPPGSAVFVGVFTPMKNIPLTRLNLTLDALRLENDKQHAAGNILVWADAFGNPQDPRYTAIWGPNPAKTAWSCDAIDEDDANLQQRFDGLTATGARPAHLAVTPAGRHLEVFVDSTIGPWSSRVGMTSSQYQAEFDLRAKSGLWPLRVSASGSGTGARFAAIFATREETDPRVFRATGPVTVDSIDEAMEAYIRAHDLRGASLAITNGTKLVYAKGYTLAEANPIYHDVRPTTLFRQASVSKTFAAVATWRLIQDRSDVSLDTTMQSILNLTQPNGSPPKDNRFKQITIRHLLESNSGLPQGLIWKGEDAVKAHNANLPATPLQLARYAASFELTDDPGATDNVVYGNMDYFMLSQVIAKLAGTATFEQALNELVLAPLHMTRTRGSKSLATAQVADEARHHMRVHNPAKGLYHLECGRSVKSAAKPLVATQYGTWDAELFDGCGGLSSAVVDVARLACMFSARTNNGVLSASTIDDLFEAATHATDTLTGPDKHGFHGFDWAKTDDAAKHVYRASKGGWLPGQGTVVTFMTGGLGFVIAQNGNGNPDVTTKWYDPVAKAAKEHAWPTTDLFPQYGMPSFPTATFIGPVKDIIAKLSPQASIDQAQFSYSFGRFGTAPKLVRPRRQVLVRPR